MSALGIMFTSMSIQIDRGNIDQLINVQSLSDRIWTWRLYKWRVYVSGGFNLCVG